MVSEEVPGAEAVHTFVVAMHPAMTPPRNQNSPLELFGVVLKEAPSVKGGSGGRGNSVHDRQKVQTCARLG